MNQKKNDRYVPTTPTYQQHDSGNSGGRGYTRRRQAWRSLVAAVSSATAVGVGVGAGVAAAAAAAAAGRKQPSSSSSGSSSDNGVDDDVSTHQKWNHLVCVIGPRKKEG